MDLLVFSLMLMEPRGEKGFYGRCCTGGRESVIPSRSCMCVRVCEGEVLMRELSVFDSITVCFWDCSLLFGNEGLLFGTR